MQNPKGKLLALLAVFAAIGIITSTGAFTTVSAERTADISVAGDASALLALQPADGPNGDYASTSDGMLQINFGEFGLNDEGTTDIQDVFTITNNGNQAVNVSITDEDLDGNTENAETDPEDDAVTFYNATLAGLGHADGGIEDNSIELGTGETVIVSFYVDTRGVDDTEENDLVDRITIEANAAS